MFLQYIKPKKKSKSSIFQQIQGFEKLYARVEK